MNKKPQKTCSVFLVLLALSVVQGFNLFAGDISKDEKCAILHDKSYSFDLPEEHKAGETLDVWSDKRRARHRRLKEIIDVLGSPEDQPGVKALRAFFLVGRGKSASEKSKLWREISEVLSEKFFLGWEQKFISGGDGSYVYISPRSQLLIIAPDAKIYRGHRIRGKDLQSGWVPDYANFQLIDESNLEKIFYTELSGNFLSKVEEIYPKNGLLKTKHHYDFKLRAPGFSRVVVYLENEDTLLNSFVLQKKDDDWFEGSVYTGEDNAAALNVIGRGVTGEKQLAHYMLFHDLGFK